MLVNRLYKETQNESSQRGGRKCFAEPTGLQINQLYIPDDNIYSNKNI